VVTHYVNAAVSQCHRELASACILDRVVKRCGLHLLGNEREFQNAMTARVKITLLNIMTANGNIVVVAIDIW
jgi:3-phosphoglycerate kinase